MEEVGFPIFLENVMLAEKRFDLHAIQKLAAVHLNNSRPHCPWQLKDVKLMRLLFHLSTA